MKSSRYLLLMFCATLSACTASNDGSANHASLIGTTVSGVVDATPATAPATQPAVAKKPEPKIDDSPQKWNQMQYGSILSATFANRWASKDFTHKGIVITCDQSPQARVMFDTELLRYTVGWTDGYIYYNNVAFDGKHGEMPSPRGSIVWSARGQHPGISLTDNFADPRPEPYGPLPAERWGHYKGLFRHGREVVLNYSVGDCDVLEKPGSEVIENQVVFNRQLELGPTKNEIGIAVTQAPAKGDPELGWIVRGDVGGVTQKKVGDQYVLKIAPHNKLERITVYLFEQKGDLEAKIPAAKFDLRALCKGGTANWPQTVETKGTLGTGDGPYVVDTITVPEENPYKSWMRFGGFDFFSDGRAAICTWSGDVWIVSGIDAKLDKITWKRYAAGLFQTLGLKIVKDEVYVLGRDQITRLRDLNGDGEADQYENFNNDIMAAESFHEFNFDLQTDSKGNFYFAKAGAVSPGGRGWQRITPHNGTVSKISPDGKKFETFATGLRAPNGMSMGPHDEITVSDNEGTWTPACRLNFVSEGSFLGVPELAHKTPVPTNYGDPICWFPHADVDNSSGGGVWVTSDKWGPFRDRLLHMSYGQCSLFLTMIDRVEDQWQGAVVKIPGVEFESGISRGRINAGDGQVYLTGLKGWQTRAAKDACFQRVRFTGKPVNMPASFKVKENGIELGFSSPLDPKSAGDPDSYDIEQWNLIWAQTYGSPDVHVDDPTQKGRQPVKVSEARVSADKKSVLLVIPDIQPVMQIKVSTNVDAADGDTMKYDIYGTINRVPNYKPKPKPTTTPVTQPTAPTAAVK